MIDIVRLNLMKYMYNEEARLENDLEQLASNLRYRKADTLDMLEVIEAIVRLQYAKADHKNIYRILRNWKD